jgi:uncharacterized membrane protein
MKKVVEWWFKHGFGLMMAGFFVAVVGLILFMRFRYRGELSATLAFSATIGGFVLYLLGRIGVAFGRRAARRQKDSDSSNL